MMYGQDALQAWLAKATFKTLPKARLFVGPSGCGKHLFAGMVADKFGLQTVNVDNVIDIDEKIADWQACAVDRLYIIDFSLIAPADQNKLLKFIEEPNTHVFVFGITERQEMVLRTICNRCQCFMFKPYTVDELKKISGTDYDDFVYTACPTPGQLKACNAQNIKACHDLCKLFIEKADLASYQNRRSIISKLNFSDQYDKIDPMLFLKMLQHTAFSVLKTADDKKAMKIYLYLSSFFRQTGIIYSRLNLKWACVSVLSGIWEKLKQ